MAIGLIFGSACGARVTDEQVASLRQGVVAPQGGTTPSAASAEDQSVNVGSSQGQQISSAATPNPSPGQQQAAAGPTDNGGATDVGVTSDTVTVGLITTMSGPVPGLFSGAATGALAYAAYVNSQGGINGRKIKIDVRDDQFDASQTRAQTEEAVRNDFAIVGGFSIYDDAGVDAIERAGVANIQVPLSPRLQNSPNNFSVAPVRRGSPTGPFNVFKAKFPDAITAVGGLTADVAASTENYNNNRFVAESLGYKWVYMREFQATETDFTADVVRMRQAGVRMLFTNAEVKSLARIVKAMEQQSFEPVVVSVNAAYDANFIPLAGDAANGTYAVIGQAMFLGEDAAINPEVRLFNEWLRKVKPGFKTDLYSAYGWGSMRLFVQALKDAGPKVTRAAVLGALRKIDQFDSNGLFPPTGPASKRPATCFLLAQVTNGKWQRWDMPPQGFRCDNSTFVYRK